MRHLGRINLTALTVLLAATASIAGCGDDDGSEADASTGPLTFVSAVVDLATGVIPTAASVADDPSEAGRESAAGELAGLAEDAEALGDEVSAELDDAAGEPIAAASACLGGAFGSLGDAVSSEPGPEAQQMARRARSTFGGCFDDLGAAALRSDDGADADAVEERIASLAGAVDGLLARVVGVLASSEGAESPPEAEPDPGEPGPTTPPEDLAPPPGEAGEAADLPDCSAGPPPCLDGGSLVEP